MISDGLPLTCILSPSWGEEMKIFWDRLMIDFHTHIFSPYAREHREHLAKADPIFSRIYADKEARMIGVEGLLEAMDQNGVARSVVCGFPWQGSEQVRRENAYLVESARQYPDRIIPFIGLPQEEKAALTELEQSARAGAQGIGEWAPGTYGDRLWNIDAMRPLFAAIKEKGLPLLIHCNEPLGHPYSGKGKVGLADMGTLVAALQGITVILAHWGGGFFFYELMPEVAAICQGVYYDTAASPFLYNKRIYQIAIAIVGPQRILFGSDYPLIPPARYKQEMQETGIAEKELEAILGLNAQRLLGR
jgi:predicted TIM-barrel fold metal-dependent hydrolase